MHALFVGVRADRNGRAGLWATGGAIALAGNEATANRGVGVWAMGRDIDDRGGNRGTGNAGIMGPADTPSAMLLDLDPGLLQCRIGMSGRDRRQWRRGGDRHHVGRPRDPARRHRRERRDRLRHSVHRGALRHHARHARGAPRRRTGLANGPCQPCDANCRTFTCDDRNPCTTDTCDVLVGCVHTLIAGCTTTTTTLPTPVPCGDVNGDGVVNIGDALLVAQVDVGLRRCSQLPHPKVCDVNRDGACNIGDALRLAQCDVGLVSCTFPCTPFVCQ